MQLTTVVLAALTSLASAQKTTVVAVGMNTTLTYSPSSLTVKAGEFVQFQFHGGNHTVTQSTFDQPCQPIAMHSNVTGFHSGFLPAAASAAQGMFPTYTIQVNDTKPLWIYCAQGPHCQKGMVMVINQAATGNKTLENFKAAAAKATTIIPGSSGSTSGTGTTGGTTTSGAPSPSQSTAGASLLAAQGGVALLAAAGAALLL